MDGWELNCCWNYIVLLLKMPKKRQNIGRRTNAAKREREKIRKETKEQRAQRNEKYRLRMSQLRAAKSSQQYKAQNEAQINFGLPQNMTDADTVPTIKTEFLDSSQQNQEYICSDYLQSVTTIDPVWLIKSEIQDSSRTNMHLMPNIKIEKIEAVNAWDKSSRDESFCGRFINSQFENSLFFKYDLIECSVLLHDCLIPQNLTLISANFKSLKINTDISETFPKVNLSPLSDAPFLPYISEAYKKWHRQMKSQSLKERFDLVT